MRILTILMIALFFAACGETNETADTMGDTAAGMTDDAAGAATTASRESSAYLKTTVDAVQSAGGDITALPPSAATDNIDGWISKLGSVDGSDKVVNGLKSLKNELMQENIDGSKVSDVLGSLANETRGMSSKAPGLNALAGALQAGSDKLAGK